MMEKEYNTITLDGTEYTEINRIEKNNNTYVLLSNIDNPTDFCIKKLINDNNEDYVVELDNEDEFKEILSLIVNKLKD